MGLSIFLAQLFGIYLIVSGILCIVRKDLIKKIIYEFGKSVALIFFSGFIALILGLMIVLSHNVWIGWPLVITILGYLMIIKGLIRLFAPTWEVRMGKAMSRKSGIYVVSVISIALGVYLCWMGFGTSS